MTNTQNSVTFNQREAQILFAIIINTSLKPVDWEVVAPIFQKLKDVQPKLDKKPETKAN